VSGGICNDVFLITVPTSTGVEIWPFSCAPPVEVRGGRNEEVSVQQVPGGTCLYQ